MGNHSPKSLTRPFQDLRALSLLTTPIAYVFCCAKVGEKGRVDYSPESELHYVRWGDVFAHPDDPDNGFRYYAWVREVTPKRWQATDLMLCSRGPDRRWTLPVKVVQSQSLRKLQMESEGFLDSYYYDPTNGSISNGDLILTSWDKKISY